MVPPRLIVGRVGRCDGGDRCRRSVAVAGLAPRDRAVGHRPWAPRAGSARSPTRPGRAISLRTQPPVRVVARCRGGRPARGPRRGARGGGHPLRLAVFGHAVARDHPRAQPGHNWSSFNYSGYQAQAAYPEYRALIQTMERVGSVYGCGQAMWQYDPSLNRFGTTQALNLLPVLVEGMHRLDGRAAVRIVGDHAVPLPQSGRALGHPFGPMVGLDYTALPCPPHTTPPTAGRPYFMASSPQVETAAVLTPRCGRWPRPGPGRRARPGLDDDDMGDLRGPRLAAGDRAGQRTCSGGGYRGIAVVVAAAFGKLVRRPARWNVFLAQSGPPFGPGWPSVIPPRRSVTWPRPVSPMSAKRTTR